MIIVENPIEMDDLEVPLFFEIPIYIYIIYIDLGKFQQPPGTYPNLSQSRGMLEFS